MKRERWTMAPERAGGTKRSLRSGIGLAVVRALFVCLLVALVGGAASAQVSGTSGGTSKVESVKFSGSSRFGEEELARAIGLAHGTLVTREDIQQAADRLLRMGWFSEVRFKYDSNPKGVMIQFTVRDAPTHPVWYDNFPWFTDAEIAEAIRAAGLPYDGTAPEAGTALDAFRETIARLLKSKNIAGEVEGDLVQAPESESMIERFRATGGEVSVSSLEFSDAVAANDLRVKDLQDTIVGKAYSRYTLAIFIIEHVRPAYASRGYLRARFGEPVAQFVGDPTQPLSKNVAVRVPIEPGVLYRWGGAAWSGQVALNEAALSGLMAFVPGEPVDELKLHAGWDNIGSEYAKRGYLEAKVEPAANYNDAEGRVTYKVHIAEGTQYRMGRLVLTGLSLTAERQLLANWKIARGDIFDNSYFEEFLNGGAQKVFQNTPVHFEKIGHLLRPDPQTRTVDVLLDFK
jgi:outer membrane translocation and assembly module TamA